MRRLAVALLLVAAAFALPAHAQSSTAWVDCDAAAGELVVHYRPGGDDEVVPAGAEHAVDFHDLLDLDERQVNIVGTREDAFDCVLGDDTLHVVVSPMPGNANLLGSCGGETGGILDVSRDGVAVVREFVFEPGECHEREAYVATLALRAHAKDYRVERRRYDDGD